MISDPKYPITIFFDGACPFCASQIDYWRTRVTPGKVMFLNFREADFDAPAHGLAMDELAKALHAKDSEGQIVRGLDAFLWIWLVGGNAVLAYFFALPLLKHIARFGYDTIARSRFTLSGKPKLLVCPDHCEEMLPRS